VTDHQDELFPFGFLIVGKGNTHVGVRALGVIEMLDEFSQAARSCLGELERV